MESYRKYIIIGLLIVAGIIMLTQKERIFGATPVLQVGQGGTGASSFTAGECLVGAGTAAVTTGACGTGGGVGTSTEPFMASWFVATSTTATSTFQGGVDINGYFRVYHDINTGGLDYSSLENIFSIDSGTNGNVNYTVTVSGDENKFDDSVEVDDNYYNLSVNGNGGNVILDLFKDEPGLFEFYLDSNQDSYLLTDHNFGIGTTTPWATLSVSSSDPSYEIPLFAISTSSGAFGNLLSVFSTSTTLIPQNSISGTVYDSGARLQVGTNQIYVSTGLLDQVNVTGRVNTGDWRYNECNAPYANFNSATNAVCGGIFGWGKDGGGFLSATTPLTSGNGILAYKICDDTSNSCGNGATAANGGVGLFFGSTANNSAYFNFSTSTPVFETVAKIGRPENATSSYYYLGFTNTNPSGTTYEVEPTAGCYFVASSTLANWQAVCRTSIANTTIVDTNFASSTNIIGVGNFQRFRIMADNNGARFYMASSTAPLRMVANIKSNFPTTTSLGLGLYTSHLSAMSSNELHFNVVKVWYLQPALNY